MKKNLRIVLLLLTASTLAGKAMGQVDPHFTQYYVYPAWLNPALTGVFDGDYRASAIYRNQWSNIGSAFSTVGASLEFTTNKNLNAGVSIVNQVAGDGGFNYTTAYGNVAYTGVRFGAAEYHRVVLGLQGGLIQRKFNPSKLVFSDQWNPVTGGMVPTQEAIMNPSATSFDAGAGALYYDATPGKKANVFAGFSAAHINQAENKFAGVINEKMPVRYTVHGGVKLALSENLSLTPNAIYLRQGNAEEKVLGTYAQLKAAVNTDVLLGVNYRFKDAVSAYAGFTHNNMVLSVSYDVNTSDLGKMVSGTNSFEISLTFVGRKKVKTPEVEFVCPRL
jgi:type IX secretion system PorP/SprF family membrane protein